MNTEYESIAQELTDEVVSNLPLAKLEDYIVDFELEMYDPVKDDIVNKNISNYEGKWLVLFFYPADFTFVCPTELKDLNDQMDVIKKLDNVEVLVASTDSCFVHKGWVNQEPLLKDFEIPMVSDRKTVLSRYFGILNEQTGHAERGTFIVNPEGQIKSIEVSTEPVGRSSKELLRKLEALKYVDENEGQACPANWNE